MRTGGVDFVRVIWEISASIVISHTISARVKKSPEVRSLPVIDKNLDMKSLGQNNVWRHTTPSFKLQMKHTTCWDIITPFTLTWVDNTPVWSAPLLKKKRIVEHKRSDRSDRERGSLAGFSRAVQLVHTVTEDSKKGGLLPASVKRHWVGGFGSSANLFVRVCNTAVQAVDRGSIYIPNWRCSVSAHKGE